MIFRLYYAYSEYCSLNRKPGKQIMPAIKLMCLIKLLLLLLHYSLPPIWVGKPVGGRIYQQTWAINFTTAALYSVVVVLPGIHKSRNLCAVDIWFAISNPQSVDDEWRENVDRMCKCIVQPSINEYLYVLPMKLAAMTEMKEKMNRIIFLLTT